jgi:hypothetical protein
MAADEAKEEAKAEEVKPIANNKPVVVYTSLEMLELGLKAVGYTEERLKSVNLTKNLSRFRCNYVGHPRVYAELFTLLQKTENDAAKLDCSILGVAKTLNYFLMAIYLLSKYPTEEEAESTFVFGPCNKTWRKHAWDIVKKIRALYPEVIEWPEWWGNPDNAEAGETEFIITVDGTHCMIEEPTLPSFKENKKYYSHKFHSAGLDYEVALSIFEGNCVWVAGPYPAGKNDISVFRRKLKQKILDSREVSGVKHRAVGDRGYRGEDDLLSVPSSQDTEAVRTFKSRALSRQETFNTRLKNFNCLDERFRHGIEKHADCFYACTVIVQLQIDNGSPLFQV